METAGSKLSRRWCRACVRVLKPRPSWGKYTETAIFSDLGEIVRNMLLYLIDFNVLFEGHSSIAMNSHYGFDTALVSAVESAKADDEVLAVLTKSMGINEEYIKSSDIEIVKWACRIVSSRAASLSACALAAVILHTGQAQSKGGNDTVDIGIDGT